RRGWSDRIRPRSWRRRAGSIRTGTKTCATEVGAWSVGAGERESVGQPARPALNELLLRLGESWSEGGFGKSRCVLLLGADEQDGNGSAMAHLVDGAAEDQVADE